ncbi:MAG: hypothetical protein RLZ82_363 [Actinomycetota bacterium]
MDEIKSYNNALDAASKKIANQLREQIDATLKGAESKIWHGAPVWFIGENAVVGYSKKKAGVSLLFWNGSNFGESKLKNVGSFFASEMIYTSVDELVEKDIKRWLKLSKELIWDSAAHMRKMRAKK